MQKIEWTSFCSGTQSGWGDESVGLVVVFLIVMMKVIISLIAFMNIFHEYLSDSLKSHQHCSRRDTSATDHLYWLPAVTLQWMISK